MIIEMIYNIFSEKSLKSSFLHEHFIKTDHVLNDKIFAPILQVLFSLNSRMVQQELQNDIGNIGENFNVMKNSTAECKNWYYDTKMLASIIKSNKN